MKKLLLIITLFSVAFLNAQTVFQDDFSTYSAPVNFTGSGTWSNSTSTGFPGTGGCSGSNCVLSKIIANPVSYLNYGSSINSIELKNESDGVGTFFSDITTQDIYVGMVLNIQSATTTPQDHFRVYNNGSFIQTAFRMFIKQNSSSDFVVGIAKAGSGNPIAYTTLTYTYNTNHLIILNFKQLPGTSDDSIAVYVDPVYAAGQPATPSAFTSALANSSFTDQSGLINMMAFRQNSSSLPTGRTGLISVSKSWEGLTFQPLATQEFSSSNFTIVSNEVKSGLLSIKSNVILENVNLNVYDIQGRVLDNKTISLNDNENNIQINSIVNSGVYIVELVSEKGKFSQKIVVN